MPSVPAFSVSTPSSTVSVSLALSVFRAAVTEIVPPLIFRSSLPTIP